MEINILILAVIVILIPILFIIGSMCSYVAPFTGAWVEQRLIALFECN